MECSMFSTAVQPYLVRSIINRMDKFQVNLVGFHRKRLSEMNSVSIGTSPNCYERWRVHCDPVNSQGEIWAAHSRNISDNNDKVPGANGVPQPPLTSEQFKALLANNERTNLLKKLTEANQHNRFLKRQLLKKDSELANFKSDLAIIEHEIKDLVALAKEIANYDIPAESRKINGKYIQSRLFSRLEVVNKKLAEHIKDVDAAQLKEVTILWYGMAESVQVMGSFDGWTQGEHLSSEFNGTYTTFSTVLMLKTGRYEIKFLVDDEWKLSPEFPIAGEGLMQNNILIVK